MKTLVATIAAAALTLSLALASAAGVAARTYLVPCREFDSVYNESYIALQHKPRQCVFGGQYSYNSAYIKRIRWRSYGGRTTHGMGILRANMGYTARIRFMLYRPRRWEESAYWYTRLRGRNLREGITFRMKLRIY